MAVLRAVNVHHIIFDDVRKLFCFFQISAESLFTSKREALNFTLWSSAGQVTEKHLVWTK